MQPRHHNNLVLCCSQCNGEHFTEGKNEITNWRDTPHLWGCLVTNTTKESKANHSVQTQTAEKRHGNSVTWRLRLNALWLKVCWLMFSVLRACMCCWNFWNLNHPLRNDSLTTVGWYDATIQTFYLHMTFCLIYCLDLAINSWIGRAQLWQGSKFRVQSSLFQILMTSKKISFFKD